MLSKHPKRTRVMTFKVTENERDVIITRATKAGKSASAFVRIAALRDAGVTVHTPDKRRTGPAMPSKFFSSSDGNGGA